jgi:hypothetical protein
MESAALTLHGISGCMNLVFSKSSKTAINIFTCFLYLTVANLFHRLFAYHGFFTPAMEFSRLWVSKNCITISFTVALSPIVP